MKILRRNLLEIVSIATLSCVSAMAQQGPATGHVIRVSGINPNMVDGGPEMGGGQGFGPPRGPMPLGPMGMWWKNPDVVQKLALTTDQQKKMDEIFQQSRLQLIDLKANVEKQELLLEPMLAANPPDTNKVLGQIDQVAAARAALEKATARMLLGIRGVLSADQWTKLQADRQHFGPRLGDHGPDGPGGGGGPRPNGGKGGGHGCPEAPVTTLRAPNDAAVGSTA